MGSKSKHGKSRIIKIVNMGPGVNREQIYAFFRNIGRISECKFYPEKISEENKNSSKVAFVKFSDSYDTRVSLHLNETVIGDRAIHVTPFDNNEIPSQTEALIAATSFEQEEAELEDDNLTSRLFNTDSGLNVIRTTFVKPVDTKIPKFPDLPENTDRSELERIRRTIYVSNLDKSVVPEQLLAFFSIVGEVMYVRMTDVITPETIGAYIEFSLQKSVVVAFTYNNAIFRGKPLKISHSISAIEIIDNDEKTRSVDKKMNEALKQVRAAEDLIAEKAASMTYPRSPVRYKRSRSRHRSRSKRHRRKRTRSRSRSPRRHRRKHRRSRSRSRGSAYRSKHRSHRSKRYSRGSDKKSETSSEKYIAVKKSSEDTHDKNSSDTDKFLQVNNPESNNKPESQCEPVTN
ncbi:hypothetical protein A3Q56_02326 [Intoshia linei]|uniref:RRM domain-containing protein n=1 Tax=Intoshia linei TaxID=1819745 RepID=A0A177B8Y2_9BILA|nr:hypothetical protein A3Q56_02326 [Intoshia linei]